MFFVDWDLKSGWGIPKIVPFEDLELDPFNCSLHYAIQCFEGYFF